MNRLFAPRFLLALLLLLAAHVLVACGGGARTADTSALIAQTFGPKQSVHSGQLALALDANLQGTKTLSGPISVKLNGPFQGHGPKTLPDFKFSLLLGTGAQTFSAGVTSTAGKAWVQFAGADYLVPDSVFSQFTNSYLKGQGTNSSGSSNLARFGIDPRRWLTGAHTVGHTKVAGTDTVHIAAGVDVPKLLADFNTLLGKTTSNVPNTPKGISPATQAAIAGATKSAAVDIYTGDSDHALRRLKVALKLSVAPSEQAALRGLTGGTIGFDLQLSELGKTEHVSAPANAKPLSGLPGFAAGAARGSSPGTASGTASAPSPRVDSAAGAGNVKAPKPYLDCVTKAGGDVPAIQKCQTLINAGQ